MKKIVSIVAMLLMIVMATSLIACGNKEKPSTGGDDANKVTVSWYYGSKVLKEEKVEKGSKLTSWTPTQDGKSFTGWYADASCAIVYDFEQPVNENIDLFAAFKSEVYVEDTNEYYLIGTGAADLGKANWDHANALANLKMTKQDSTTANIYKIQVKMYAGDRFQVCYGGSWDGQQGIGIIPGAEYCDGINDYDKTEYKAADKKVAQVKDANGNVVFTGSDEYNKAYNVWNIILAEGQDGIYEFTLTTYPDSKDYNTLEFKLIEKVEALTQTHDMHIIGTHNEWNTEFAEGEYALTQSEDKATWVGFLKVTKEMYADWTATDPINPFNGEMSGAFKVYNTVNGEYIGIDGNNIFLQEGTYCFKYTVATNTVEVQKLDYYVVGTLLDAEGKAVNYAVKEGVSPKLTVDGNKASVVFEAYDATGIADYSWMKDQNKPGVISIKVVYGCELGILDWYSAEGGDNWYLPLGSYDVVLDLEAGAATVTAK